MNLQASSSYFDLGDNIELHEDLTGNQNIVAAEVLIHSDIYGELFVMGGSVEVSGSIEGNTVICAGNTSLRGTFHSDLTIYGGNVTILPECKIYGKLKVFAANTEFMGDCLGPSQFMNSNLRISGLLQKECRIYAAKIIITSTAVINGPINYTSPSAPNIYDGAYFKMPPTAAPVENVQWTHGRIWSLLETGATWISFGMNYLFSFVLGLLLLRFFPRGLTMSIGAIESSFGKSLVWGICATLIVPIVIMVLFATLLGIPLAFTLLALCIVTFASAKIVPILWCLKKWHYRKGKQPIVFSKNASLPNRGAFAIGLLIFLILAKIPLIGIFVSLLSMLLGVGGMLKSNLEPLKTQGK